MILNVGCGSVPDGDVNVDVVRGRWVDVVCDGQFLPFKDGCFEMVFSSHVIEHIVNPYLFLRECFRVAVKKVVVVCPHRFDKMIHGDRGGRHLHFLNIGWFSRVLEYPCRGRVVKWFLGVIPLEIRVVCFKRC